MIIHQIKSTPKILLALIILLLYFTASSSSIPIDQSENQFEDLDRAINIMASKGFENIRVHYQSGILSVDYENRIYFREKDAIKIIVPELMDAMPDIEMLKLFPSRDAIPLFEVDISENDYQKSLAEGQNVYAILPISSEHVNKDSKLHKSSVGKVDITIQPFVTIALGRLYDPFIPKFAIVPEASIFLGKGFKSLSRLSFLLYNEQKPLKRNVALNALYLEYTYKKALLKNTSLYAGYFGQNRYGLSSDIVFFVWDNKLGLGGTASYLGNIYYIDSKAYYTKLWNWTALGNIYYRVPSLNILMTSTFGRFLHQDYGISLKATRFFNNAGVGVFATRTDKGKNYGVELQLLTYPRRNMKPYYVRLCLPTVIKAEYWYRESLVGVDFSPLYNNIDPISDGIWLMDIDNQ